MFLDLVTNLNMRCVLVSSVDLGIVFPFSSSNLIDNLFKSMALMYCVMFGYSFL